MSKSDATPVKEVGVPNFWARMVKLGRTRIWARVGGRPPISGSPEPLGHVCATQSPRATGTLSQGPVGLFPDWARLKEEVATAAWSRRNEGQPWVKKHISSSRPLVQAAGCPTSHPAGGIDSFAGCRRPRGGTLDRETVRGAGKPMTMPSILNPFNRELRSQRITRHAIAAEPARPLSRRSKCAEKTTGVVDVDAITVGRPPQPARC